MAIDSSSYTQEQLAKLSQSLHALETGVLSILQDGMLFDDVVNASQLKDIEVMRSLQWLSNKGICSTSEIRKQIVELDANGKKYLELGLPEERFLKALSTTSFISVNQIAEQVGLDTQEIGVTLGALKSKAAIITEKHDSILVVKRTEHGEKLCAKPSFEFLFLQNNFPLYIEKLEPEQKFAYDTLLKRKHILRQDIEKTITINLTDLGKALILYLPTVSIGGDTIDHLSRDILVKGSWKKKQFRHYDIHSPVPAIKGGKRHFVRQSIDSIKRIWLEMGFVEMEGTMVQSAFWDLDALFVPQDHPARAMQDSFYIKDPAHTTLPADVVSKIKAVHEHGADTGSKGWGGVWSEKEASQNMLRTHTTVLSAKTIATLKKSDLPAKFFVVNKVYRNEVLTWKHLFEFHQVEGIVIDPNATLAHLKGYLETFYKKLGFEKVRMRPGHFPYTEPSLEVDVFHPIKKEWVELGGAGIFRPEVVKSLLGIDVPVLAWGQGLERGIMQYYKLNDIRELYNNDIKQINEVKLWK